MAALPQLAYGAMFLLFGIPMALWPETISWLKESIDSIGRKPAGPVEPADWLVIFTKYAGIALSVVGGILVVLAFLG